MDAIEHFTTVVVGAGPAGVMAASAAAARGSVLLVDSSRLPRDKSCGGMLNEYAQAFFDEMGVELPRSLFVQPERIDFRYFDWDRDIRKPTSLRFANVDRAAFDEWLMRCLPDNVEVRGNTRFESCDQDRDGAIARLRAADDAEAPLHSLTCEYLIGADGPRSQVRRCLPVSQLRLYKTLQDYLPLHDAMEPYFDCVYARGIGAEYGYGYVIPKGDEAIVGSVFFPGSKNVSALHDRAVDLFSSYFPYGTERTRREAWSAVEVRTTRDIVGGHGRVLLAGEAGGIFSPSSGEGISFALNSGLRAGVAVEHAREGATVMGRRDYPSADESDALRLYRLSLASIKRNIARRLRYFPVLNSDWGKAIAKFAPDALLDKVAHQI